MESRIVTTTNLGNIVAEVSPDPENPGIALGFEYPDGSVVHYALLEATRNSKLTLHAWDKENEDPRVSFEYVGLD